MDYEFGFSDPKFRSRMYELNRKLWRRKSDGKNIGCEWLTISQNVNPGLSLLSSEEESFGWVFGKCDILSQTWDVQ